MNNTQEVADAVFQARHTFYQLNGSFPHRLFVGKALFALMDRLKLIDEALGLNQAFGMALECVEDIPDLSFTFSPKCLPQQPQGEWYHWTSDTLNRIIRDGEHDGVRGVRSGPDPANSEEWQRVLYDAGHAAGTRKRQAEAAARPQTGTIADVLPVEPFGPGDITAAAAAMAMGASALRDSLRRPPPPSKEAAMQEALEDAWGIIANAGQGNWLRETPEWQAAAIRWRDTYLPHISANAASAANAEPPAAPPASTPSPAWPNLMQPQGTTPLDLMEDPRIANAVTAVLSERARQRAGRKHEHHSAPEWLAILDHFAARIRAAWYNGAPSFVADDMRKLAAVALCAVEDFLSTPATLPHEA